MNKKQVSSYQTLGNWGVVNNRRKHRLIFRVMKLFSVVLRWWYYYPIHFEKPVKLDVTKNKL